MKTRALIVLLAMACCRAVPAAETFKIDPAHSTIAFTVRHMLGNARGTFTKFGGTIEVDRQNPAQSSVTVRIAAASIDTGIAKRDDHLRGELFNVEKYPDITFQSRRVKQTGATSGEIVGDLSMHGVRREITLNVQMLSSDATRWKVTTAPIRRSEFGLVFSKSAETVSMISDEVAVEIEIEAK
jgi:polyisoprenoid-binding protein YceI